MSDAKGKTIKGSYNDLIEEAKNRKKIIASFSDLCYGLDSISIWELIKIKENLRKTPLLINTILNDFGRIKRTISNYPNQMGEKFDLDDKDLEYFIYPGKRKKFSQLGLLCDPDNIFIELNEWKNIPLSLEYLNDPTFIEIFFPKELNMKISNSDYKNYFALEVLGPIYAGSYTFRLMQRMDFPTQF